MERIEHTTVTTNGIKMHVASIGTGPPILFLHGFFQLWYSWRHQLLYLSSLGYRRIAPDLRGYGDTDAPESVSQYTGLHVVGDLVWLLDAMGIESVYLVGTDYGAIVAWWFCLFRPDRIKGLVNSSVPFMPRHPDLTHTQIFKDMFGDDYYFCRFQVPGEAENDFAQIEKRKLFRSLMWTRNWKPPVLPKEVGFRSLPERTLLDWLTEDDINYYATKYEKTGFTGGLNYYRAVDLTWELMKAWSGAKVKVPVQFIVGDLDPMYHVPGVKEYLHNEGMKKDVPFLEEVIVMEGVGHFISEEKPEGISNHIHDFIKKF